MRYWLFDGEDITGPFAPADIAARADFSDNMLVCPESDSEKDDAWKPVCFFEDFSAQSMFEAVQGAEDDELLNPPPTPQKKPAPQPQKTKEEIPQKIEKTSVQISSAQADEPIFTSPSQPEKKEPELQPTTASSLPLIGTNVIPQKTPEIPAWHEEEKTAATAPVTAPGEIQTPDNEPTELVPEATIQKADLASQTQPTPKTESERKSSAAQKDETENHVQEKTPVFLLREKRKFIGLIAGVCVLILLILGGCFLLHRNPQPVAKQPIAKPQPAIQQPQENKEITEKPAVQKTATEKTPAPNTGTTQNPPAKPVVKETVIPVPPPPANTTAAQQEKALAVVKNYTLSGNRGTVENYFNRIYAAQLKQGYHAQWSAEPLHKNTYIVKYRLTKTRTEPIIYVFQADATTGKLTGALNNITLDLVGKI